MEDKKQNRVRRFVKNLLRTIIFVVSYQFFSYLFWGQFQLNSHFLYQVERNQNFNFIVVPLDQWNQLVDTQELIRKQFKTIYHSLDEVPAKHKKMKNGRLTFLRGGFVFTREESSSLFKRTINENQWISPIAAEFRKDNYYFILGFWIKINDYVSVS